MLLRGQRHLRAPPRPPGPPSTVLPDPPSPPPGGTSIRSRSARTFQVRHTAIRARSLRSRYRSRAHRIDRPSLKHRRNLPRRRHRPAPRRARPANSQLPADQLNSTPPPAPHAASPTSRLQTRRSPRLPHGAAGPRAAWFKRHASGSVQAKPSRPSLPAAPSAPGAACGYDVGTLKSAKPQQTSGHVRPPTIGARTSVPPEPPRPGESPRPSPPLAALRANIGQSVLAPSPPDTSAPPHVLRPEPPPCERLTSRGRQLCAAFSSAARGFPRRRPPDALADTRLQRAPSSLSCSARDRVRL